MYLKDEGKKGGKSKEIRATTISDNSNTTKHAKKMEERNIFPASVPPVKIVVDNNTKETKSFIDKLKIWQ